MNFELELSTHMHRHSSSAVALEVRAFQSKPSRRNFACIQFYRRKTVQVCRLARNCLRINLERNMTREISNCRSVSKMPKLT